MGIRIGMKNSVPNFLDGNRNGKTVFPTKVGKELTKESWEKLGTRIPAHAWNRGENRVENQVKNQVENRVENIEENQVEN